MLYNIQRYAHGCSTQLLPHSTSYAHIPQERWVEVAQRHSNGESLRQLAKIYGVSHEAIRQVVKRVAQEDRSIAVMQ